MHTERTCPTSVQCNPEIKKQVIKQVRNKKVHHMRQWVHRHFYDRVYSFLIVSLIEFLRRDRSQHRVTGYWLSDRHSIPGMFEIFLFPSRSHRLLDATVCTGGSSPRVSLITQVCLVPRMIGKVNPMEYTKFQMCSSQHITGCDVSRLLRW
jgi:hypothetical protein